MPITIQVDDKPPYKQSPASEAERASQEKRRRSLKEKARETFDLPLPLISNCSFSIRYSRKNGRSDSANIIGGIADALQGVVIKNDRQITEINYAEWRGDRDWYEVIITELTRT